MDKTLEHSRENESIPIQPLGVARVELHELVEEDVSNRGHTPTLMLADLFDNFKAIAILYSHGRARVT